MLFVCFTDRLIWINPVVDKREQIVDMPPLIVAFDNNDVIIPCKPTSRLFEVELYEKGHEVNYRSGFRAF